MRASFHYNINIGCCLMWRGITVIQKKPTHTKHVSVFIRRGCLKQVFGGKHYKIELTRWTIMELMKCSGKGIFLHKRFIKTKRYLSIPERMNSSCPALMVRIQMKALMIPLKQFMLSSMTTLRTKSQQRLSGNAQRCTTSLVCPSESK